MKKSELILVVHALTQWNVERRPQGHIDVPLNEAGREMARLLAGREDLSQVSRVLCSDMCRAVQTAEPLAKRLGLPIEREINLRERREANAQSTSEYALLPFPIENENESDFQHRVVRTLSGYAAETRGQLFVVSHWGAAMAFVDHVRSTTSEPRGFEARRAALNRFTFDGIAWKCIAWGDDRHLNAEGKFPQ
ncbi:MAG TPA: histidine phosphatase family protein [Planctomycetota bacterium]|nr:histidine phosphatase family protein [Planctomycetota bacterium]